MSNRPISRVVRVALLLGTVAALGAACSQPPASEPEATTTTTTTEAPCIGQPGTAGTAPGPVLTVSKVTCLEVGDVVTVTGTGFSTSHLGTRPPLAGQPSGAYAVFGKFAAVWQPSLGSATAPGSTRTVLAQAWNVPEPSYSAIGGAGAGLNLLAADGSFTTTLTIVDGASANPNLVFASYPGSGAVNASNELSIAASWAP